jgi:hypothetical protein
LYCENDLDEDLRVRVGHDSPCFGMVVRLPGANSVFRYTKSREMENSYGVRNILLNRSRNG